MKRWINGWLLLVLVLGGGVAALGMWQPPGFARAQGDDFCPPPMRFDPADPSGRRATIAYIDGVGSTLRSGPGLIFSSVLAQVDEGIPLLILGGPFCVDGFNWWEVQVDPLSLTGWISEREGDERRLAPMPLLPAGTRPLRIATLSVDGTLGLFRSEEGWQPVGGTTPVSDAGDVDPGVAVAFHPAAGQWFLAQGGRLEIRSLNTGGVLRGLDVAVLTGIEGARVAQLAASPDGSALLWTLADDAGGGRGLWRLPLDADAADALLPAESPARLDGPFGETARAVVTPEAVYPLTPDGQLGESLLSLPGLGAADGLPPLSWSADGLRAYLPLRLVDDTASAADYAALNLAGGTAGPLAILPPPLPGTWGIPAPDGAHVAQQDTADGVAAWRVYDSVSGAVVADYPLAWTDLQWTPDALGLLAREGADDDLAYYGLDGSRRTPYLPNRSGIVEALLLGDGTTIYRQFRDDDTAPEGFPPGRWYVERPAFDQPLPVAPGVRVLAVSLGEVE